MVKEMSFEQAKKQVAGYIKKKGTAETDELAENLRIDLGILIDVLNDLQNEGHIREVHQGDKKIIHRSVRYPERKEIMVTKVEVYDRDADPQPKLTEKVATDLKSKYTPVQLKNLALLLLDWIERK